MLLLFPPLQLNISRGKAVVEVFLEVFGDADALHVVVSSSKSRQVWMDSPYDQDYDSQNSSYSWVSHIALRMFGIALF